MSLTCSSLLDDVCYRVDSEPTPSKISKDAAAIRKGMSANRRLILKIGAVLKDGLFYIAFSPWDGDLTFNIEVGVLANQEEV